MLDVARNFCLARESILKQVHLDGIDKSIVRELQLDGRAPFAQLGPKVGLSQAAVRNRVNRLLDAGVMQIVAVTDPESLGFGHQVMLGINVDHDASEVARRLAEHDVVEYLVLTAGRFDILAEIACADADELLHVINLVIRTTEGVASIESLNYLRVVKQTYNWGTV